MINRLNTTQKNIILFIIIWVAIFPGCKKDKSNRPTSLPDVPIYSYNIKNIYPHAINAFTQGLIFDDGFLYEGTGLYGQSTIRKVDLQTGKVLQHKWLSSNFFGEGITIYKSRIIQLTWKSRKGFIYNKETFELIGEFDYSTEGWGITHDEEFLIMSDGTPFLYFLDPESFTTVKQLEVKDQNVPLKGLNELEYINGDIFANVWPTERIVIINLKTGNVKGWIDTKGILQEETQRFPIDVLNGIAYDKAKGRIFITGKMWPKLFEIELTKYPEEH